AGGRLVGGQRTAARSPKWGYATPGEVPPDQIVTPAGAFPGDPLSLTKPLCSGLVATAIKHGLCPPDLQQRAIAVMTHLNRQAAEAMVADGGVEATDITGYGLLGHLANLRVGAEIQLKAVPVLEGVRELVEADLFPGGTRRNHAALRESVDWGGLAEPDQLLLCDAQTS